MIQPLEMKETQEESLGDSKNFARGRREVNPIYVDAHLQVASE
jgi:hypothetical protein